MNSKIIRNYMYNTLFQVLVLLTPIILSPYLARVLGPEKLGVYSYAYNIADVIVSFALLGTYTYGCRQIAYVREKEAVCKKTYQEVSTLRLILGTIGSVIYLAITYIQQGERQLVFVILYFWVMAMILDPSWFFVGQEDMKPTAVKNSVIKIVTVCLIFCFVKSSEDITKYTLIISATTLVSNLVLYFQFKKYNVKQLLCFSNLSIHLRGSIALFWTQIATMIYLKVDKIMIEMLTKNASNVAFYDQAEKIVTIPLTFVTVLSTVMMPKIANEFANQNNDEISRLLNKAGQVSLFMACPMMVGIAIIANHFVPWFLGDSFLPSAIVISIISPIIVSNSLSGISGKQFFTATNQINVILIAYMSTAVVNVTINALLIPKFSYIGAAVATVISSYISVLIQYYIMNKQVKMNKTFISGMKYLACSFIMGIIVFYFDKFMSPSPITTIAECVLGFVIYFILLFILRDKTLFEMLSIVSNILRKKKNL